MASFIGIVSPRGKPLTPTTRAGRVRHLLKNGQARIISHHPFTLQTQRPWPHATGPIRRRFVHCIPV